MRLYGLAWLPRSRSKEMRSRLPGWQFLHINTRKQASPVAGVLVQRYRHKLFFTYCQNNIKTTKFSHINTRDIHPAHLFPYKQALSYLKHCDLLGRCLMYLVRFDDQLKLLNISLSSLGRLYKGYMIMLFTG